MFSYCEASKLIKKVTTKFKIKSIDFKRKPSKNIEQIRKVELKKY